jgi:hypothetical protein
MPPLLVELAVAVDVELVCALTGRLRPGLVRSAIPSVEAACVEMSAKRMKVVVSFMMVLAL